MTDPAIEAPLKRSRLRPSPSEPQPQEPTALAPPPTSPGSAVVSPDPKLVIPGSALLRHDVVQVNENGHANYGLLFIVGDVVRGKVHGYHMTERHGQKEFITVPESAVLRIGASRIRAAQPCSAKWRSDHQMT